MPNNYWIFLGSLFGGSAIVFGAFGAHYLKQYLDASSLLVFETGVRYQIYHALALVLIGVISFFIDKAQLTLAAYCFIFGTIFFSGSLYLLSLMGMKSIGILTPFGGLLLIMGWLFLAIVTL